MSSLRWAYLGRLDYRTAYDLQNRLRRGIVSGDSGDTLLMLEHPPVITLGRSAQTKNVLISDAQRAAKGVDLVHVDRGGDVTYHGPGQLVGYPIRHIGRAVRQHVQAISETLSAWLATQGVAAAWRDDAPGLWTDAGKIAAVGVDARGGVAIHGFSLNLQVNLDDYQMLIPCGSKAPVTSLHVLTGSEADLPQAAEAIAPMLAKMMGCSLTRVELSEL